MDSEILDLRSKAMNITNESAGIQSMYYEYFVYQMYTMLPHRISRHKLDSQYCSDLIKFSNSIPDKVFAVYFNKSFSIEQYCTSNIQFIELGNDRLFPSTCHKETDCVLVFCDEMQYDLDFWDYNKMAWLRSKIVPKHTFILST